VPSWQHARSQLFPEQRGSEEFSQTPNPSTVIFLQKKQHVAIFDATSKGLIPIDESFLGWVARPHMERGLNVCVKFLPWQTEGEQLTCL
jgi:hypothetical protein